MDICSKSKETLTLSLPSTKMTVNISKPRVVWTLDMIAKNDLFYVLQIFVGTNNHDMKKA